MLGVSVLRDNQLSVVSRISGNVDENFPLERLCHFYEEALGMHIALVEED